MSESLKWKQREILPESHRCTGEGRFPQCGCRDGCWALRAQLVTYGCKSLPVEVGASPCRAQLKPELWIDFWIYWGAEVRDQQRWDVGAPGRSSKELCSSILHKLQVIQALLRQVNTELHKFRPEEITAQPPQTLHLRFWYFIVRWDKTSVDPGPRQTFPHHIF